MTYLPTNKCKALSILLGVLGGILCIQPKPALANAVGTGTQNFNPITSGLDFVTVQSSETLQPGYINVGLFLNYAVNTLPYFVPSHQSRVSFEDTLLSADFNLGVGLLPNWDVGISMPYLLRQSVSENSDFRGQFAESGSTEFRLNTKYRFYGTDDFGAAVIASVNFNRIENDPFAGTGAGPTFNLEVAADRTVGPFTLGANLGYRFRSPGDAIPDFPIEPLRNQLIASVAGNYLIGAADTRLIVEIFSAIPTQKVNAELERTQSSIELLVGAKRSMSNQIALHAGVGTELLNGIGSPDWRIYTGLNWSFGPTFAKERDQDYQKPEAYERFTVKNILFKSDSDQMVGAFQKALAELAEHLNKPPGLKELIIEGHTDSLGSDEYNQKLSARRAEAIKRYLATEHGIPEKKMKAVGFGESQPIADNGNYQGRQSNRRVEFQIKR